MLILGPAIHWVHLTCYGMRDEQRAFLLIDESQLSVPEYLMVLEGGSAGREASRQVKQPHDSGPTCPQAPVQRASGHLTPTMVTSMGSWSQTLSAQGMVLQQTSLVSGPSHPLTCRRSRSCEYLGDNSGGDDVFGVSLS